MVVEDMKGEQSYWKWAIHASFTLSQQIPEAGKT